MHFYNILKKKCLACGIMALCFGYFAAYVPYSMMTKMVTKGWFDGMNGTGFSGFEIQPVAAFGSFVGMFVYVMLSGWIKHVRHTKFLGIHIPRPQWYTLVSGVCLSMQICTTTLAYTFSGISIVFAMLLMRGGVLVLAPIVDIVTKKRKRKIYWPSWIGAILSFAALFTAVKGGGTALTVVASIDIAIYLFVYFFRLWFMSSRAKSDDVVEKKRYFTEEQIVANTALLAVLFIVGLFGIGMDPASIPSKVWQGFIYFPTKGYFWHVLILGIFSYGTGLFGTLIFLDKRENTFTVPANRCASVIAGVIATYSLAIFYGDKYPGMDQIVGVALILTAIIFLSYRQIVEKKSKLKAKAKA